MAVSEPDLSHPNSYLSLPAGIKFDTRPEWDLVFILLADRI